MLGNRWSSWYRPCTDTGSMTTSEISTYPVSRAVGATRSTVRKAMRFGLIVGATACVDIASPPGERIAPGSPPGPALARMQATVDLRKGTMTFAPIRGAAGASADGFRPQIYGQQGQMVLLYNSPPVTTDPSSPGLKTISANVGLKNLLNHRIGDEQNLIAPPDTMGIYVFFTQLPVVTQPQPCTGCTVRIANAMGVLAFDAPNEPYFYWRDIVDTASLVLRDTTLVRTLWTFEASQAVTQFSFEVLVSAPWPPPNETTWRIEYPGDSAPNLRSEPLWDAGGSGSVSTAGGVLTLDVNSGLTRSYSRQDSLRTGDNGFMSANMRMTVNSPAGTPSAGFILNDNVRSIGLGLSGSEVGFTNGSFTSFLPGTTRSLPTTSTFFDYQIRKFAADSVQLWVGGARQLSLAYSSFDLDLDVASPAFQAFLVRAGGTPSGVQFDNVIYRLGQSTP